MSQACSAVQMRGQKEINLGHQPEGRLPGGSGLEGQAVMRRSLERERKAESRCGTGHEHWERQAWPCWDWDCWYPGAPMGVDAMESALGGLKSRLQRWPPSAAQWEGPTSPEGAWGMWQGGPR